jgi:hypothetical protein
MALTPQALERVTWRAVVLVLLAVPAHAEESRFADVRLIEGRDWNGGVDEAGGTLISDTQAKRLRFEATGRSPFDVRFDQLRAGRYEQSRYPPRSFRRSGHYLTLHYVRDTGEHAFGVFRLPGGAVADLLAVFERDTGMSIERGPAATSFLGLPVHLAVGTRVQVTDHAGARVRGTVVRLSSSSVDLGASGRFDVASVRQIDVRDGVWEGVAAGTVAALLPALFVTLADCVNDACSGFGMLSSRGWAVVGAGAAAGAALDAGNRRQAYRRTDQRNSSRVEWRPMIGNSQKGVLVSLQF